MPAETAAEVDKRLVYQRIRQLGQQAQVVANLKEIAQRVLDSGIDPMVGLSLDSQASRAGQTLERWQKEAFAYPAKHRELLYQSGLGNILLETGERQADQPVPEPAAAAIKPATAQVRERGSSRWQSVKFEVDGVELKLTGTEKSVMETLVKARTHPEWRSLDLVRAAFPHYPESKMEDATRHWGVVVSNLRRLKLPNTGLDIVHHKPSKRGEAGSYSLPVREGFVPPTDGYRPDMLSSLPSSGVLDLSGDGEDPLTREDFEIGPLTFSEADKLVLAIALLKNYDSYKDPKTGRLAKFGLNLSAQKAGEIRMIVGEEEVSHNFVPGPVFNRIIQLITKIISTPQVLRRQNPFEMGVIFDLFGVYNQKPNSVQDLDKNLRDLLGSWMKLRRVSR